MNKLVENFWKFSVVFHFHIIHFQILDSKISLVTCEIPEKCALFHIRKGRPLLCTCQVNELIIWLQESVFIIWPRNANPWWTAFSSLNSNASDSLLYASNPSDPWGIHSLTWQMHFAIALYLNHFKHGSLMPSFAFVPGVQ